MAQTVQSLVKAASGSTAIARQRTNNVAGAANDGLSGAMSNGQIQTSALTCARALRCGRRRLAGAPKATPSDSREPVLKGHRLCELPKASRLCDVAYQQSKIGKECSCAAFPQCW